MNTPLPESACRVCIYLHKGECGHSHGPLNPRGDYCGGQVLTSKAKMEPMQAQERKPLTDEQITEVWRELRAQKEDWSDLDFARAIEAYIKEQP